MTLTADERATFRTHPAHPPVTAPDLAEDLRRAVQGEVRFDDGSRALYATDASNYRQVPIGVVIPRTTDDVVRTVAICRQHGAPVLARGGGTSLAGQCCNVAVVLDFTKYLHHVLAVDPDRRLARVQPGTVLDDLRDQAEQHHLTFGPDPATHNHNTLGGMIGNDSCGVHSVMAGKTVDNVHSLDVLTYDGLRLSVGQTSDAEMERLIRSGGRVGEIYAGLKTIRDRYADRIRERFPKIPRRVSGYNLDQLLPENGFNVARALVGTEGTCVTVLEATLNLVSSPKARTVVVLGYPDVYSAGDDVPTVTAHQPIGCEGFDNLLVQYMEKKGLHVGDLRLLPEGGGWLLVEFGGETKDEADDRARQMMADLKKRDQPPSMKLYHDKREEQLIWEVRESGLGATASIPGIGYAWPGWEDSAVRPDDLGDYLRDLRQLMQRYHYDGSMFGHFGQACLHLRVNYDLESRQGIATYRRFIEEAADLVLKYGGSFSGEHGDGQARAELLPKLYGDDLVQAMVEFKRLWDPDGKMNPGKMVNPNSMTANLRLGEDYHPWNPETHFSFADDQYSFAYASLRCVGVGKCRRESGGVMCPSYMATREEQHATRGRAHLLFEMLQGQEITDGWKSEHVKESLDLCLACKGCKGDCPVNVDMATYKAEFLSHYYAGRLRPRSAYAFGLIMYWAQLAKLAPGLVNFTTQTPLLRDVVKRVAGVAPQRQLPRFANETFQSWFQRRGPRNPGQPPLILWPDTFNNHFHTQSAQAAVEVLEDAGYQVLVPRGFLCCGRPFYDYGMLNLAERHLKQTLRVLRPEIRAGIPLVALEPSCVSVFRDELKNLLPHDQDAKRLAQQSYTLAEFLDHYAPDFAPPATLAGRKALLQGHCHQKSVLDMDAERRLLGKLKLRLDEPDPGCCGMAGAFGFEAGQHYQVSMAVGEQALLPALRQTRQDTLLIADGFSCREQVRQSSGRLPLHLAEVLRLALHGY